MKKIIIPVLIIICFSCGTPNKPVSDAQEEIIKTEIKKTIYTINKALEEVKWDIAYEPCLNSPDFSYVFNGKAYNYEEFMALKPSFNNRSDQKCTVISEKYAVLDNSKVLYTLNCTWLTNYKDGHSVLVDPAVTQVLFTRIDKRWKVLNIVETGIEKIIPGEKARELNQIELLKQFAGDWEIPIGKDTALLISVKSFHTGKGYIVTDKLMAKGRILAEGTGFWAYDDAINKINLSLLRTDGEVIQNQGIFTTAKTYEYVNVNNSPSYTGVTGCLFEFTSPDEIKGRFIFNNQEYIQIMKRIVKPNP